MSATTGLPRKDLLRVKEVSVYFDVSPRTIYRWIDEGVLESKKVRGCRFVVRQSVSAALSNSTDEGLMIL